MSSDTEIIREYLNAEAPIVCLSLDRAGVILDANGYAEKVFGGPLRDRQVEDLWLGLHGAPNLAELAEAPADSHRLSAATASGPQDFVFRFFALQDRILCLGHEDATEQARLREELIALNSERADLMRELHKSRAELVHLNEVKNQFLGMAAHELRQPVSVVMSHSQFVLDEASPALSDEHREFLTTILHAARSMKRIIDNFLDLATIESGHLRLDRQPVDLPLLIRRSVILASPAAKRKRVELVVEHHEATPVVWIDGAKIEQALGNLLDNAIRHSHSNSVVAIVTRHDAENVVLSVEDKGVGMASEDLDQLFRTFERGRSRRMGGQRGWGLGLAIARKIIEEHGGRIWAESRLNEGTTFSFTLPRDNRTD